METNQLCQCCHHKVHRIHDEIKQVVDQWKQSGEEEWLVSKEKLCPDEQSKNIVLFAFKRLDMNVFATPNVAIWKVKPKSVAIDENEQPIEPIEPKVETARDMMLRIQSEDPAMFQKFVQIVEKMKFVSKHPDQAQEQQPIIKQLIEEIHYKPLKSLCMQLRL